MALWVVAGQWLSPAWVDIPQHLLTPAKLSLYRFNGNDPINVHLTHWKNYGESLGSCLEPIVSSLEPRVPSLEPIVQSLSTGVCSIIDGTSVLVNVKKNTQYLLTHLAFSFGKCQVILFSTNLLLNILTMTDKEINENLINFFSFCVCVCLCPSFLL